QEVLATKRCWLPRGVGYQEVLATKRCWLPRRVGQEEIEWLACGSHHRQMVDEGIRRLAQPSTAWRRWLPRGVGYALLAYSIPTLFRSRWIRYHEGGKTA
ncbi:MAG: hypothetical protein ACK44Z_12930, partial [Pirellulaceae bacterium]